LKKTKELKEILYKSNKIMPTKKTSSKPTTQPKKEEPPKMEVKSFTVEKKEEEVEETNNSSESEIDVDSIEKKKRGRKPKSKVESDVDSSKQLVPKKRGRRPKDKTYTIISNYKEVSNEVEEDNIILHLPMENDVQDTINENDIKIETNGILKYDPNLCEPLPYEPMNSMISGYALISDKLQEKLSELNEIEDESKSQDKMNIKFEEKNETNLKCTSDEVFFRDVGFEEDNKEYFRVLKKAKILKLMLSDNNKKEWDLSTDSCCFYCTEKFQTVPIGIPVRYFRGKFYCRDIFCSFNCAAAYIFSGFDIRYNFKKWEYYSLLCLLASMITSEVENEKLKNNEVSEIDKKMHSIKIKLAEDRNLLKKFGGPLPIEKFRENFYILDSQYSILYPPLSCMYPQAEIAHYVNVHRQKAQILNSESRFSCNDSRSSMSDLRLKREKPLIHKKNTLEEYMSLKIN